MAICKVAGTEAAVCVIQGFQHMRLLSEPILNDNDCPHLTLSNSIFITSTENIKRDVSIVHEYTSSCKLMEATTVQTHEREEIQFRTQQFKHDWAT